MGCWVAPAYFLHKKKKAERRSVFPFSFVLSYSALIAPVGQPSSQAPQSMQTSGSTTYLPSPSDIADTGHTAAQAPHIMHSSEITCAMKYLLK